MTQRGNCVPTDTRSSIVGEADHPEVEGIMAHAGGEAVVVESVDELPERLPSRRVGVVVQTTQSESLFEAVVAALVPRVTELRVYNTICSATVKRQRSAAELAESVDVVVVVGGHNSGNTTRLVEICREINPRTYHVETPGELDRGLVRGRKQRGCGGRCVDARSADARGRRRHRGDGVDDEPRFLRSESPPTAGRRSGRVRSSGLSRGTRRPCAW